MYGFIEVTGNCVWLCRKCPGIFSGNPAKVQVLTPTQKSYICINSYTRIAKVITTRGDACDIGSTVKGIAKEMPVLLKYAKQRIVALKGSGLKHGDVVYALRRENITTSRQTVRWFYFRYLEDGTINWRPGSGRPLILAELSLAMVEQLMQQDDKTTAMQIYSFLACNGVDVSLSGRCTRGCTGLFEGQPTVNLFGKQINKSVWNGLSYILTTMSMMSFGLMKQLFSCNHTSDIAAVKKVSHPV